MPLTRAEALKRYEDGAKAFADGDKATAIAIMQSLADAGVPEGLHFIGWCFEQGVERAQDPQQAFAFWSKAAAQGFGPSQTALGVMYQNGVGVERDCVMAYVWHVRAAMNNEVQSQQALPAIRGQLSTDEQRRAREVLEREG